MPTMGSIENKDLSPWYSRISTENSSLLLLTLSAASYSFMGCFVKLLTTTHEMPAIEIVFIRAVVQISVVVIAMFFVTIPVPIDSRGWTFFDVETQHQESAATLYHQQPIIKHPFGLSREIAVLCVIRGVCGASGFCLYFYTISALPLGDAVTLLSLNPVITVMIAPFILDEPLTKTTLISAALSILGSVFLAQPPFLFGTAAMSSEEFNGEIDLTITAPPVKWGYLTGVLGACTGAGVYVLLRKAGKKGVHTLNLLFSWCIFGLLFSSIILVMSGTFVWPSSRRTWIYLALSCAFGLTAHFILNFAARLAPAGIASITRSSGIVWSYMLEMLVFHEVLHAWTIFGVGLVMISLAIIALHKHRETTQEQSHPHIPLATSEEDTEDHGSILQLQVLGDSKDNAISRVVDTEKLHHRRNLSATSHGSLDDEEHR